MDILWLCVVCMQPHHTTYIRVSGYAFNDSRSDEYMVLQPTQAAKEERTHLPQFYRRERRPYINDQPLRASVSYASGCKRARRSLYSFLKKPSSGRGWLMSGREASGDRIHLQFPIEFHRRSKRLSWKCWTMRWHVLCILNFMLLQWWSLIKSNEDQEIYDISFYFVNIIVNNKSN